ncbi:Mediator complex protein [Teratosphaeria destructans]|uniref:Mediator of RNA polymerase II transcription subunit 11 n=1 Tax=Teratosphaeria destructans TaxID=418781 RepID=A0A9W7W4Z4_9PEZI|nr:Mediator complex protein [Teratosphaeria destructans]
MAAPTFTPADRIRELNGINEEIASTLTHAGNAITANAPKAEQGEDVDARKRAMEEHVQAFLVTLQSATTKLKRSVYALEEAGIIEPDATTTQLTSSTAATGRGGQPAAHAERITNGGMGNLDVGYLNSRGNQVGAEKEAELMEEARRFAEGMLAKQDEG